MWCLVVFIVLTVAQSSYSQSTGKCCDLGQILKEYENSTYDCIEDTILRNSVLTTTVSVLINQQQNIKCADYSTNFYEFEILEKKIIHKKLLSGPVFPKCCPIGYIYNTVKHSCHRKSNYDHSFIQTNLVSIGLPQCEIIIDTELEKLEDTKPEGEYCEDETNGGFVRRECKDESVCDDIRCVKKCCPDGKSFVNGAKCVDTYTNGLDLSFSSKIENTDEPFAIIHNHTLCPGIFYLMSETRYIFSLLKNGEFKYWKNTSNSFVIENPTDSVGYCLEHSERPNSMGYFFFNCLTTVATKQKFQYTKWPKILSCIFLALTIVIYVLLKQIRKIFGKILMNYCLSTLFMYALLTYAQLDLRTNDGPCQIIGFCLVFVATASFAFLNVMCCDIWLTFGSTKNSVGGYQRRKDFKKLIIYLAYGWGMPLVLTLMVYGFSITHVLPDSIRPYVGISSCFISYRPGNYALLIFIRLPHLLMQLVNAFLFIRTILYCLKIKNEISRINDNKSEKKLNFNRDKEKLFLILKLAVIMGITFVADTASSFVDMNGLGPFWRNFEIIIDCINCLQGVYIFIIFICKRAIFNDFLKIVHIKRRDAYINNTESFTSTSRISLKTSGKNGFKN